jgi:hypothetical protein
MPEQDQTPKQCRTCKYWIYDEGEWGVCRLAESSAYSPVHANSLAVALDYEGYEAHLRTNEAFGCVQWEAKDNGIMSDRDWERDWEWCERATPGKWEVVAVNSEGPYLIRMPYPKGGTWYGVRMIAWKEDAEFIAAAHEALPYWLQRVRELEQDLSINNGLLARQTDLAREAECRLIEVDAKEAEAAALRAALLRMVGACERYLEERPISEADMYDPEYISELRQSKQALSTTAGKELLEENRRLRTVAKAAKAYVDAEDRMAGERVLSPPHYVIEAWMNLVEALAALEEVQNK